MNSVDSIGKPSREAPRRNASVIAPGLLRKYEAKPNPMATPNAKARPKTIPKIDAAWLTTAFRERREFRKSFRFSQKRVSS